MAKIIYSSYHFSVKKISFIELALLALLILLFGGSAWLVEQSRRNMSYFIRRNKPLETLQLFAIIFFALLLIILFSFVSATHFVLTNENLYLYTPLYPFAIRKISLDKIKLIAMKSKPADKEKPSFTVHLKDGQQFVYTMPWGNKEKLQEQLKALKISIITE